MYSKLIVWNCITSDVKAFITYRLIVQNILVVFLCEYCILILTKAHNCN